MADINGLDALQVALAAKVRQIQAALPGAVEAGARPIHQEIDRRLPRDTGDTERALETVVRSEASSATATVQIRDSAVGEINEAAVFLEFGTSKMPAEPSFRPGFIAGRDDAVKAVADTLTEAISK